MAAYFSSNVSMCLCLFLCSSLGVYSQLILKEIDRDVDKSEKVSYVVTESMLDAMLMDITAGTTPRICTPHVVCGFQPYDENTWLPEGDFVRYCQSCSEGFECKQEGFNMRQRYFIYQCVRVNQTTATENPTTRAWIESSTESKILEDRRGSLADIHEL